MASNGITGSTKTRHKVAAVQIASVGYDLVATLDKVQIWAEEAAAAGAELIVFPEALVSAYPRKLGFQIGARSPADRDWYKRYLQSSVRVPPLETREEVVSGPVQKADDEFYGFQRLARLARSLGLYLSIGVIERSLEGATTWCTNLIFSPKGQLISRHRKFQPTAAERVIWSQGEKLIDGKEDNLPVVKTELGKVGGLICWENFMPLARYALYRRGIEIYLAPTADARDTWLPTMQHIAQEGRVFVISANQFHTSQDFPEDYPARVALEGETGAAAKAGDVKIETWSRGGSCIVGPLGAVLAGPLWDKEGILYADIDTEELIGAKLDFDVAGHYSRHDLMLSLLDP